MKLKKRQFARLKDIAETVNHILPGTGIKLDKLIADIESVQKVKMGRKKEVLLSDAYEILKQNARKSSRTCPGFVYLSQIEELLK